LKLLLFHITFISSLAFGQWNLISPAFSLGNGYTDIHFNSADTGYVTATINGEGAILRTVNGGSAWDTTYLADITIVPESPFAIHFPSDSVGYAVLYQNIIKTVDYGNNWFLVDTADVFFNALNVRDVIFINNDTGYVGWADGGAGCLLTIDGGLSWVQDPNLLGVRNFNEYDGIVTSGADELAVLDSFLLSWELFSVFNTGSYHYRNAIYCNNKFYEIGYDLGSGFGVYSKTEDMGITWVIKETINELEGIKFLNDSTGHMLGEFSGSIKTTDGGDTWYFTEIDNFFTGMSKSLTDISFVNDTLGYGISNDGIYKTTNGGGTSQGQVNFWDFDLGTSDAELNISIYPNPATDILTLETNGIQINAIEIYSLFGQLLISDKISDQEIIDVSYLKSGVYIVSIISAQGTLKKRLIKR
jgi:photosystem II stability/assembly factor-like uncharacterized protein